MKMNTAVICLDSRFILYLRLGPGFFTEISIDARYFLPVKKMVEAVSRRHPSIPVGSGYYYLPEAASISVCFNRVTFERLRL